ncbi:MAG: NUDIX hydrolase [Acidimicrobiia bacterium]
MNDHHRIGNVGQLSSQRLYQGKVIDLALDHVLLPNGNETDLEIIRHRGAAVALPIVGDGELAEALLVRQYRYAANGWLLEVPGGKLDDDESPEDCARRELTEEIGYHAGNLEPMGSILTTPGFTDERIWLFLATDLKQAPGGAALEDNEVLEMERIPLIEAIAMAEDGRIVDSKTVVCLLRARSLLLAPQGQIPST